MFAAAAAQGFLRLLPDSSHSATCEVAPSRTAAALKKNVLDKEWNNNNWVLFPPLFHEAQLYFSSCPFRETLASFHTSDSLQLGAQSCWFFKYLKLSQSKVNNEAINEDHRFMLFPLLAGTKRMKEPGWYSTLDLFSSAYNGVSLQECLVGEWVGGKDSSCSCKIKTYRLPGSG